MSAQPQDGSQILDDVIERLRRLAESTKDLNEQMKISDRLLKAIGMRHRLQKQPRGGSRFDLR